MTRHHALKVFTTGFVLITIHNMGGGYHSPLLETIPYLLIFIFWSKMKDMVLAFLLMLLGFLELNHSIFNHIPQLQAEGFGGTSVTSILYDIGSLLFIAASMMILQIWHVKKNKEN